MFKKLIIKFILKKGNVIQGVLDLLGIVASITKTKKDDKFIKEVKELAKRYL